MPKPSRKLPDRSLLYRDLMDRLTELNDLHEGLLNIRPDMMPFRLEPDVITDFQLMQLRQLLTAASVMLQAVRTAAPVKNQWEYLHSRKNLVQREIANRISKLDSLSTSVSLGDFLIDDDTEANLYAMLQVKHHLAEALRLMQTVEAKQDELDASAEDIEQAKREQRARIEAAVDEMMPDVDLSKVYRGGLDRAHEEQHPVVLIEQFETAQDAADPDAEARAEEVFAARYAHDETSLALLKSTADDGPDEWTDDEMEAAAQNADDIKSLTEEEEAIGNAAYDRALRLTGSGVEANLARRNAINNRAPDYNQS